MTIKKLFTIACLIGVYAPEEYAPEEFITNAAQLTQYCTRVTQGLDVLISEYGKEIFDISTVHAVISTSDKSRLDSVTIRSCSDKLIEGRGKLIDVRSEVIYANEALRQRILELRQNSTDNNAFSLCMNALKVAHGVLISSRDRSRVTRDELRSTCDTLIACRDALKRSHE